MRLSVDQDSNSLRPRLNSILSLIIWSLFSIPFATADRPPCTHDHCAVQNSLFGWIESNGGYINPKVELSTGPDENWTIRGVFATSDIGEGEKIFSLPPAVQLCDEDMCGLVRKLRDELEKGEESFYWPYISAMEDHRVDLPAIWNEHERSLLAGLQPTDWLRHMSIYEDKCGGDVNDAHHLRAMLLVVARVVKYRQQYCMTPLYDFLNHANGDFVNTFSYSSRSFFGRAASTSISRGSQLFNSFGISDVGRLFRDYGFIPQYPRLWAFLGKDDQDYVFECQDNNGIMMIDTNPLGFPHQVSPQGLAEQLRLVVEEANSTPIPEFDWDDPRVNPERYRLALEYRQQYLHAMSTALQAIESRLESSQSL